MVHMLIKILIINIYDNYQSYWSYGGEILPKNMHLWRSKTLAVILKSRSKYRKLR